MRKQIFFTAALLASMIAWSMDADAGGKYKYKYKHKHHGHYGAPAHYSGHYREYRPRHRRRNHDYRAYRRSHYYRPARQVRYYAPQRRTYVYGPPPPGVSFEYYRPEAGIWVRFGF